jgi:snRNA-activating protein complex subunit 3
MNAGAAHSHESQFGPCSDLVNVSEFLREVEAVSLSSDAAAAEAPTGTPAYLLSSETREEWDRFDVAKKEAVSKQCVPTFLSLSLRSQRRDDPGSVSDIKSALDDAWRNPRLVAHLMKNHHEFVASIHDSADTSSKRKRKRDRLVDPTEEHTEVTALQQKLDGIRLKSWQSALVSRLCCGAPDTLVGFPRIQQFLCAPP